MIGKQIRLLHPLLLPVCRELIYCKRKSWCGLGTTAKKLIKYTEISHFYGKWTSNINEKIYKNIYIDAGIGCGWIIDRSEWRTLGRLLSSGGRLTADMMMMIMMIIIVITDASGHKRKSIAKLSLYSIHFVWKTNLILQQIMWYCAAAYHVRFFSERSMITIHNKYIFFKS